MIDDFLKYWPIITAVGGFVCAQVIGYIIMKQQVADMKSQINGVGRKLGEISKEMFDRQSDLKGRVMRIEGYLEGNSYRKGSPVTHPTSE